MYVSSFNGKLYALDPATGANLWTTDFASDPFFSSPSVANGVVYIGSTDDRVWALDATTGEKLWSYKTGYFVDASPTVSDGKLYVGSDNMYASNSPTPNTSEAHPSTADPTRPPPGRVFCHIWLNRATVGSVGGLPE